MLLAINMGNTRTNSLLFAASGHQRFATATRPDRDHYLQLLAGIPQPSRVLLSSVVPPAALALCQAVNQAWEINVEQVQPREDLGVRFTTVDYHQLGADLFVNVVASHHCYGGNLLNVDLGSASTFCVVKQGLYLGTSIVPGMELSIRAMIQGTALLQQFELRKMEHIIHDNTIACLQSGIYFGYFELVRGMIERIQEEQGPLRVVLTGGIGTFLHDELTPWVNYFRPDLTMEGLQQIAALKPRL